jgi:Tfp pilus assembly protein PilN
MNFLKPHTSGIHYGDQSVEWTVLRKSGGGNEIVHHNSLPFPDDFFEQEAPPPVPAETLARLRAEMSGPITVALSSSKLLMRVLELPSTDPNEIKGMVELQMDQCSPFSIDQLCLSYELLYQTEDHSRVLAVAAPRKMVDELGDFFKDGHIHIRSLDAVILAWWSVLALHTDVPREGQTLLFLEERAEFSMIVLNNGVPAHFRSLELFHDFEKESVQEEIIEELQHILISLETEYGPQTPDRIQIWSTSSNFPKKLTERLTSLCDGKVELKDLNDLPPLSQGLAERSIERSVSHIELVPREWVDLQRRRQFMKMSALAGSFILGCWLLVVSIAALVFGIQQASFSRVKREASQLSGPARDAQAAREELISLKKYADHSHSALECLREITVILPEAVELSSFSYTKGNAVRLSGRAENTDAIYDFFQKLGTIKLFEDVSNSKIIEGNRFSIQAVLPKPESEESR